MAAPRFMRGSKDVWDATAMRDAERRNSVGVGLGASNVHRNCASAAPSPAPICHGKRAAPRRPAVAPWSIKPALSLVDLARADLVDGLKAVFVVPLLADRAESVLPHEQA